MLADQVRFFKESKEKIEVMCKAIEDMRNESFQEGLKEGMKESLKEGMKTTALRMLKAGKYALDEIASISGLPLDEVKKLEADKTL